ncbi:response regulator transcription factor [Spirosoma foliorum]|uniref:Response regulator transcription factor n=1 Tax=Spirosoma foliorum TaxID=2710596 RepID=A0A7G5GVJ3_9BACT|nr:response regulator transcription factor [Spirosoma foliorum]QMW02885.1 response regulator transcription factor [Spirosoma foliorum]
MRLLLADDHPLLLDGLRSVLSDLPDTDLLPPVTNGHQLLDYLHLHPVDMVLLDLNMPKTDGLTALKQIRRDFPTVKVIVFTSYNQPQRIREVQALGGMGYLLKSTDAPTLKTAVQQVWSGKPWFPTLQPVVDSTRHTSAVDMAEDAFMQKYQLTKREVEIIQLISRGETTRQIADELTVSEFTINAHRRNIARKLGIDTPVGLVNFAREQGLV